MRLRSRWSRCRRRTPRPRSAPRRRRRLAAGPGPDPFSRRGQAHVHDRRGRSSRLRSRRDRFCRNQRERGPAGVRRRVPGFATDRGLLRPHYQRCEAGALFRNRYDAALTAPGSTCGRMISRANRDRTAGPVAQAPTAAVPVSLPGTVYLTPTWNLQQDQSAKRAWSTSPWHCGNFDDGQYRNTGHTTATDAQGRYVFRHELNLRGARRVPRAERPNRPTVQRRRRPSGPTVARPADGPDRGGRPRRADGHRHPVGRTDRRSISISRRPRRPSSAATCITTGTTTVAATQVRKG